MIHTASLVHDDVLDDCDTRRGAETIHTLYGTRVAILAGDFLFAQSSWYLANLDNLEVIKLMTSLTSRDLVSSRFSWNYYYWFLTDEGIEYLREYLHLPADSVPNTLKKSTKPAAPPPRPGAEGPDGRPPRAPRPEGGREGGYRGGEGGAPRGFGRGGGAPRPAGP